MCAGCDLNATYAKFLARHNEHLKSLKFQNNNTVAVIEHPAKGQVAFQGELGSQPTAAVAATLLCRIATLWFAVALGFVALAFLRDRTRAGSDRAAGSTS